MGSEMCIRDSIFAEKLQEQFSGGVDFVGVVSFLLRIAGAPKVHFEVHVTILGEVVFFSGLCYFDR